MKIVSIVLITICIISIVIGRVATFHLTEGEAMVQGSIYWSVGIVTGLLGLACTGSE